ncbi:MAG: sulfotransferase [Xanthomonadales bacterium]|nr:sulfotransferase [Xanthomonadales bacterium]
MSATLKAAATQLQQGQADAAERTCEQILAAQPGHPGATHLMALAWAAQGRQEAAIEQLEALVDKNPGDREARRNLALLLRQVGQLERSRLHYRRIAEEAGSGQVKALVQAAELSIELDREDLARADLEAALAVSADDPDALATLAQLEEQRNEDGAAENAARKALAARPDHFKAGYVLATVEAKSGRDESARERLGTLASSATSPVNRALVLGRQAQLDDRAGQFARAFAGFVEANRALATAPSVRAMTGQGPYALATVRRVAALLDRPAPASSASDATPVFLLGFPRSGTTLMDRILAAHPDVGVLEEQPILLPAIERFMASEGELGAEQARVLADRYLERLVAAKDSETARLWVDKLPLNTVYLGLINQLFPRARVLFAVRDPRDVCLSCFFQVFGINEAMSHFLDWRTTAAYYRAVMDLGLDALERRQINAHRIRYEALVEEPEANIRAILDFLELEWRPEVLDFHRQMRGTRINTPSYAQVTRPINRSATGRWRNYRKPIEAVADLLAPVLARLDYA